MKVNYYKIVNRKTGEVEVVGTMRELAKMFDVSKSAIFRASQRDSHFLRIYQVVKCEEADVNSIR